MASSRVSSLVSSQWLWRQMTSRVPNVRVVDASWSLTKSGHEAFVQEHIPRSLFFDLNRGVNPSSVIPRSLPNVAGFAEYARTLGINHDSHLVIYDRATMVPASRAWWTFKAYGLEHVSVLNGGLTGWKAEGYPVEAGSMTLPDEMGDFEADVKSEYMRDMESVLEASRQGQQIVDARKPQHFRGEDAEPAPPIQKAYEGLSLEVPSRTWRAGHIPGSVNLHEDSLIDKETKCLLPKEELEKVFVAAGVDLSRPLTTLCYNGNAACLVALAAKLCGQQDISIYYGSWAEYGYKAPDKYVVKEEGTTGHSKHGG